MKIKLEDYRAEPGAKVKLDKWPTRVKPHFKSKEAYEEILADHVARLCGLQKLLYAGEEHAVLIIFQGMDAAGKDGAIAHVMSGLNPQGVEVSSFKQPSAEELKHDFLWRTTQRLPERGRIGIFNRSYYEEALVVRVHPELLRSEGIEETPDGKFWRERYESIRDFERHLRRNRTVVLKFFLHLSRSEQRRRFLARIDDADKNWKFSMADVKERGRWKDYQKAYAECIEGTTSSHSPWHVIPADDKENARVIISTVILEALEALKMAYPVSDAAHNRELQAIRRALTK